MSLNTLIHRYVGPTSWRLKRLAEDMASIHAKFKWLDEQREKRIKRETRCGMSNRDGDEPLTYAEIDERRAKLSAEFTLLSDAHSGLLRRQRVARPSLSFRRISI